MKCEIYFVAIALFCICSSSPLLGQDDTNDETERFTRSGIDEAVATALKKAPENASAQFNIPGLVSNFEFKTLDNGVVGIDYRLDYSYSFDELPEGASGTKLRLEAYSKGFISDVAEIGVNSIISEIRLTGHNFTMFGENRGSFTNWKGKTRVGSIQVKDLDGNMVPRGIIMPQILKKMAELSVIGEDNNFYPPKFGEAGYEEYQQLAKLQLEIDNVAARFLEFDFHIKSETDQNWDDQQYVIGLGLTTDSAIFDGSYSIAKVLDAPFSLFRNDSKWVPQLPRFYFGYDYVTKSDIEARRALTDEDEFSRLTFQTAWMTKILDNVLIRLSWQTYYELDAPQGIKDANEDWTSFIEITASFPIQDANGTSLILKYVDGDLPSTLENSSEISLGFSINF